MKFKNLALALGFAGSIMLAGQAQAEFIIDDFDVDATTDPATSSTSTFAWQTDENGTGSHIMSGNPGWTRDYAAADTLNGHPVSGVVCSGCGTFEGSSNPAAQGAWKIQWDGAESGADIDTGVLTFMAATKDFSSYTTLYFEYSSDLDGLNKTFTFYTDASNYATVSALNLANTGGAIPANLTGVYIDLSSAIITGGAFTWSSIAAIEEYITGPLNIDFQQDNVKLIPEPGSLALLGLGIVGLGWHKRRRNLAA